MVSKRDKNTAIRFISYTFGTGRRGYTHLLGLSPLVLLERLVQNASLGGALEAVGTVVGLTGSQATESL